LSPPDCFREGERMLFIDPDECIDCDACRAECPVEAIFPEDEVPEAWKEFVALNREMAATCPQIIDRKEPLALRPAESLVGEGRGKGRRCRRSADHGARITRPRGGRTPSRRRSTPPGLQVQPGEIREDGGERPVVAATLGVPPAATELRALPLNP
jgi:ferredoxin